jgi:hypothetical protein
VSQDTKVLDDGGRLQSTLVLLVKRRHQADIATAIGVVASASRSLVASVSSDFADGTSVATGFSRSPSVFPRDRRADSVNFAWVRDAGALGRGAPPADGRAAVRQPPQGRAAAGHWRCEYLEQQRDRELRRVVDHGEYYYDAPGRLLSAHVEGRVPAGLEADGAGEDVAHPPPRPPRAPRVAPAGDGPWRPPAPAPCPCRLLQRRWPHTPVAVGIDRGVAG